MYSYGGTRASSGIQTANESKTKSVVVKKNTVEEKIEDLVKKSKDSDVTKKDSNPKFDKIMDVIKDGNLTKDQILDLSTALVKKAEEFGGPELNKVKNL